MKRITLLLAAGLFLWPVLAIGQTCLPNGDMDNSGTSNPADVVHLFNYVSFGTCSPCDLSRGDLNCDGFRDAADIVLLLYCVYVGSAPLGPCPISNVRPLIPDPRDSVIVESKLWGPGSGNPHMNVRVYITNKDNLSALALPLNEVTNSGTAYAVLATPRTFNGVVTPLTNTLSNSAGYNFNDYGNTSPDKFFLAGVSDLTDPGTTIEPPNATRKAIWDIKFNSVTGAGICAGQILLDSTRILDNTVQFVDENGRRVPVNFLRSLVTISDPFPLNPPNLRITLQSIGPARKGQWAWIRIKCQNLGTCPSSGTVIWTIPPQLSAFKVLAYTTVYNNVWYSPKTNPGTRSVSWVLPTLPPNGSIPFFAAYKLPCLGPPNCGTKLTSTAQVQPVDLDFDELNNYSSESRFVFPTIPCGCPLLASHDSEERELSGTSMGEGEKFAFPESTVVVNDTLVYLVDFQNIGPDSTGMVVVRDTLDVNLDEATIETDGSSHPYTFSLNGREASWTFSNIGLPDSATNEDSSIGFVAYTIRPKSTAPPGAEFENYASLYFDGNPAISTDTTSHFLCAAAKGDMNGDFGLSPADVVLMLNCVFLASGNCDLCFADVNCSADLSPADVVVELNMVFLAASPPC